MRWGVITADTLPKISKVIQELKETKNLSSRFPFFLFSHYRFTFDIIPISKKSFVHHFYISF